MTLRRKIAGALRRLAGGIGGQSVTYRYGAPGAGRNMLAVDMAALLADLPKRRINHSTGAILYFDATSCCWVPWREWQASHQ